MLDLENDFVDARLVEIHDHDHIRELMAEAMRQGVQRAAEIAGTLRFGSPFACRRKKQLRPDIPYKDLAHIMSFAAFNAIFIVLLKTDMPDNPYAYRFCQDSNSLRE